jgi:hypothetical protein
MGSWEFHHFWIFPLNVACHRHHYGVPRVAWMEWMALAGQQAAAKRRTGVAKQLEDARSVAKVAPLGLAAERSVAMVALLGLVAELLPGAIPAMAA